jgi:predicted nucleic acid-binding protein
MIVVSNSTPLISLTWINRFDLFQTLYNSLVVPDAVWHEVVNKGINRPGALEVQNASWIQTQTVKNRSLVKALQQDLDAGEAEAIALALELNADLLIMDERLGRRTAQHFDLSMIGTVGVLISARQQGLIDFLKPELDKLRNLAGFRLSENLYQQVLRDAKEQQ